MLRRLYYLLLIPLFLSEGCIKKPEYPDVPSIEFFSVNRDTVTNSTFGDHTDSIVFTVLFKDGTGDLGLAPTEPPYTEFDVQYNSSGDTIKYNGTPPYSCKNYTIFRNDTVLISRNSHFYNYFIELLVKQSDGTYLPFELPDCGSLMGRYPPLAPKGYRGPLEGSLSFTLINRFYKTPLENKTIKFRLSIEDRAFNKSNTVESSDVSLTY